MIPAAASASTAASSSGSVSWDPWPPQRARNASQAPAKHFFFSHISCPNFSKNLSRHSQLSRCLQRWGLNIVFVAINTSFGDADAFPKLLLREVFIFPQFPEPKPEIEYLSTSHIHAPHGLYYMG